MSHVPSSEVSGESGPLVLKYSLARNAFLFDTQEGTFKIELKTGKIPDTCRSRVQDIMNKATKSDFFSEKFANPNGIVVWVIMDDRDEAEQFYTQIARILDADFHDREKDAAATTPPAERSKSLDGAEKRKRLESSKSAVVVSNSQSSETDPDISLAGFMEKQGGKLFKQWQLRRFELHSDHLCWYAPGKADVKNILPLVEIIDVKSEDGSQIISLISTKKVYNLRAFDKSSLTKWVASLKKVIEKPSRS